MYFPNLLSMFSYRNHKIAMNVIALPLSPIICESSVCLLYITCVNFIFSCPWKTWLLLQGHMWQSLWHWVCQLSLTVGLQPLPGAALKRGVTPPLTRLLTPYGLISHLGPDMFNRVHICFLALWVVILLFVFTSFLLHKIAQIFKSFRNTLICFEKKGSQKMDSWLYNDWCILCSVPLFAVLCSEKMERCLEMTEKAV